MCTCTLAQALTFNTHTHTHTHTDRHTNIHVSQQCAANFPLPLWFFDPPGGKRRRRREGGRGRKITSLSLGQNPLGLSRHRGYYPVIHTQTRTARAIYSIVTQLSRALSSSLFQARNANPRVCGGKHGQGYSPRSFSSFPQRRHCRRCCDMRTHPLFVVSFFSFVAGTCRKSLAQSRYMSCPAGRLHKPLSLSLSLSVRLSVCTLCGPIHT